jgi:hypothetical protein
LRDHTPTHTLPYWGEPLPDEILGSWLMRMVLMNAIPSFPGLLEWLALDVNAKSVVADPWKSADYVRAIATRLGYDHDNLLRATTSRGYRDCFLTEAGKRRSGIWGTASNLMACPKCMERDFERYGSHTSHPPNEGSASVKCYVKLRMPMLDASVTQCTSSNPRSIVKRKINPLSIRMRH